MHLELMSATFFIGYMDHSWSITSTVISYGWGFIVGVLCIIGGHSRLLR